jgi:hypothetical protein
MFQEKEKNTFSRKWRLLEISISLEDLSFHQEILLQNIDQKTYNQEHNSDPKVILPL